MADEKRYAVRTVDGHQYVYVGDLPSEDAQYLECEDGIVVNLDHVVALVPFG